MNNVYILQTRYRQEIGKGIYYENFHVEGIYSTYQQATTEYEKLLSNKDGTSSMKKIAIVGYQKDKPADSHSWVTLENVIRMDTL